MRKLWTKQAQFPDIFGCHSPFLNGSCTSIFPAGSRVNCTQKCVLHFVRIAEQQLGGLRNQREAAADQLATYTAMAMWIVFASSLIGLLAAALDGWPGSSHIACITRACTADP